MNIYRTFAIVSVAIAAFVLIVASLGMIATTGVSEPSYGYLNTSQLNSINVTSPGVHVSRANSTIYVNASGIIPVMMGPMDTPSMYSFEILGVTNPTIVVREGVSVQFTAVNVDNDSYHNFALSSRGPPFSSMGSGMMGGNGYMTAMHYLPPMSSGTYAYANFSYVFHSTGSFWYLCTYPGHAQDGMYGRIVVS